MKYEEIETEIKKLAEIVKGFPAEIREQSFEVLLNALIKEKGWESDIGLPPEEEPPSGERGTVITKIAEATGINQDTLSDIFDPSGKELKIDLDTLKPESAAERIKAYVRLLYLYKKTENRQFSGMPAPELRKFVEAQGETEDENFLRPLKKDKDILTARKEGRNVVFKMKSSGPQKIINWLKKELGENA
ncbi:MAG: hypothetical protein V3W11_10445 [bacterium]